MGIVMFKQQEIIDGKIRFVHNGARVSPSYEVKVSDGSAESTFETAIIYFILPPNYPFIIGLSLGIGIPSAVLALLISVLSVGGICLYKRGHGKSASKNTEAELEKQENLVRVDESPSLPTYISSGQHGFFQQPLSVDSNDPLVSAETLLNKEGTKEPIGKRFRNVSAGIHVRRANTGQLSSNTSPYSLV